MTSQTQAPPFTKLLLLERQKSRKEASLWIALALYLIPALMVIAADLVEPANRDAGDAYFIFHNQTMLVLPMAAGTVATAMMRLETANATWFVWLTSGAGAFRLWLSKLIFISIVQAGMCLLSIAIYLPFLLVRTEAASEPTIVLQVLSAYGILNTIIAITMTLLVTTVILLWRNTVSAMATTIVVTVLSLILMAADFSWALPTAFAYRLGLSVLDETFFYQDAYAGIGGAMATVIFLLLLASIQYAVLQHDKPRRLLE